MGLGAAPNPTPINATPDHSAGAVTQIDLPITLGTVRTSLAPGRPATVRVPLDATGRRLLKARRILTTKLGARWREPGTSRTTSIGNVTFRTRPARHQRG